MQRSLSRNPWRWLFNRLNSLSRFPRRLAKTSNRKSRSKPRSKSRSRKTSRRSKFTVQTSTKPFLQKCQDPTENQEIAIATQLADNPDHVVLGLFGDIWCWTRNDLREWMQDRSHILQNCSPKGNGFNITRDLDKSKRYIKINNFLQVEENNLLDCLSSSANYQEAVKTLTTFSRMGSVSAMDDLQQVGSSHCQPGQTYTIYKLVPRVYVPPPEVARAASQITAEPTIKTTSPQFSSIDIQKAIEESFKTLREMGITIEVGEEPSRKKKKKTKYSIQPVECRDTKQYRFPKNQDLTREQALAFRANDSINPVTNEPVEKCKRLQLALDYTARKKYGL